MEGLNHLHLPAFPPGPQARGRKELWGNQPFNLQGAGQTFPLGGQEQSRRQAEVCAVSWSSPWEAALISGL